MGTADESKFCAGLPGALAPVGEFDPLNFLEDLPIQEIKRFREAEVTHGRVSMLACIGYLVAENSILFSTVMLLVQRIHTLHRCNKFHPFSLHGSLQQSPFQNLDGRVQDGKSPQMP